MAESLSTLRARVRSWLNVQSTVRLPDSVILDALNEAQDLLLGGSDLRFAEDTLVMAWQSGVNLYTPTQAGKLLDWINAITYVSPTSGALVTLNQIDYDRFLAKYTDPSITDLGDEPADYTIFGQASGTPQIYVGPTPTSDIAGVTLSAYWTFTNLSADADTNELINTQWYAIFYKALSTCATFIEDDRADKFAGMAEASRTSLVIRQSHARWAGTDRPGMQEPH